MRKILIAGTLIFTISCSVSAADDLIAPNWSLTTADNQVVRLSDVAQQQTTVLLFWATWCPYCKALMPHLQSIRLEYGDDVEILAINIFEDGDPVSFMQKSGYDFTLLLNGDEVADDYGVTGTPAVFVLDHDRRIHFDLSKLPRLEPPDSGEPPGHSRKAAFRAPFWAAEISKSLDSVNNDT